MLEVIIIIIIKMMNKHFMLCLYISLTIITTCCSGRSLDASDNTNQNETINSSQESTSVCVREGTAKNPKSYADCKEYNNPSAETICCLVSGTSGGTEGTSCLDVDILFENKTIEYNNNGVTGKLICSTESQGRYMHTHIHMFILLMLLCIVV